MTFAAAINGDGTIFSVDTNGNSPKDLFDFNNLTGADPWGDLTLLGNKLFGMTYYGGTDSVGVIFSFNYVTAGINELKTNSEEVKVFPNPSNSSITVQLELTQKQDMEFVLYNSIGKVVYDKTLSEEQGLINQEINVSLLSEGLYLLKVNEGNQFFTKKIIKEDIK